VSSVSWPFAARAQQALPVIGFLNSSAPDADGDRMRAYREGLSETGYVEGRNVTFEYRWADGKNERLPAMATEPDRHGWYSGNPSGQIGDHDDSDRVHLID
jgi:hypothetical protein